MPNGASTVMGSQNALERRMKYTLVQHSKTGAHLIRLFSATNFIVRKSVYILLLILTVNINISYIIRTLKFVGYSATGS